MCWRSFFRPPTEAILEVAQAAGVVEMAHPTAQSDDAAHALDGYHQTALGKADTAGFALEKGEELLLLTDVPSAISGREAVRMMPSQLADAFLERFFHAVGRFLGNHAAQCIGNEHAHHVALFFQPVLVFLEFLSRRTDEHGVCLGTPKLAFNNFSDGESGHFALNEEAEAGF